MGNAYKDCPVTNSDKQCAVTFDKTELDNIIEFIEIEFLDSIRRDPEIDNIEYVVSMMSVLQKLRFAYDSLLNEESETDNEDC